MSGIMHRSIKAVGLRQEALVLTRVALTAEKVLGGVKNTHPHTRAVEISPFLWSLLNGLHFILVVPG